MWSAAICGFDHQGVVVEEQEGGNTKFLQLIFIQRYQGCTEETNVSLPNSNNINYNKLFLAVMPLMTSRVCKSS